MKGLDGFMAVFGGITLGDVALVIVAIVFVAVMYRKVSNLIIDHNKEKERQNEELHEALEGVRKYPQYRQQSINIQHNLESEIQGLRQAQDQIIQRLERMEQNSDRRDRNKLRDMLLQSYRYYTNKDHNPSQSWTRMEAEAFWELFGDYEDAGGNGYMHSDVKPAMMRLTVIEMTDIDHLSRP